MNLTSILFLALTAFVALIYWKVPARYRKDVLLIYSAGFLATWSWQFIIILLLFGWMNYWVGIRIQNSTTRKKTWLIVGIFANLFILFFFKYNNFFLPALVRLFSLLGVQEISDGLKTLLPIGLSYLVVQAISYQVDLTAERVKAERDLLKFWVYVLYFPKLLSGPVERARLFFLRLDNPVPVDRQQIATSFELILKGLFRKLFLADGLFRMIPADAFITPKNYAGQHLVFWLLAYAFAFYNDFAAYTSLARGISLWFGIELTNNFNLPYLSRNFSDFWTRWHISFSNWLRDYIYFPISRKLMKKTSIQQFNLAAIAIPPIFTMLASGLWHGAAWNVLLWGGLHGVFLMVERLIGMRRRPMASTKSPYWRMAGGISITFILTVLAWLPFRMRLPVAINYFLGMFHWVIPSRSLILAYLNGTTTVVSWSPLNLPNPVLLLLLLIAVGFDLIMCRNRNERELQSFSTPIQVLIIVIMLILIFISLFSDSAAPFVYQAY